tara:strand:- start:42 stop:614 length:573 start_codon:yes stop_codon:yes gene_type:complete
MFNLFKKEEIKKESSVKPFEIFSTPYWFIKGELPDNMYQWARKYESYTPSTLMSNRGGYQSEQKFGLNDMPLEYIKHLEKKLLFLPKLQICNWWLNINYKGNYNASHTHPGADLALVWYITDNHNLLKLRDYHCHTRQALYSQLGIGTGCDINALAGDIVIFPADIDHEVRENPFDEPRISISMNLSLIY